MGVTATRAGRGAVVARDEHHLDRAVPEAITAPDRIADGGPQWSQPLVSVVPALTSTGEDEARVEAGASSSAADTGHSVLPSL